MGNIDGARQGEKGYVRGSGATEERGGVELPRVINIRKTKKDRYLTMRLLSVPACLPACPVIKAPQM